MGEKPSEVLWAEKRLGKPLQVLRYGGGRYYVQLTDADIRKLTAGPSPWRLLAFAVAGFAAARLLVWFLAP